MSSMTKTQPPVAATCGASDAADTLNTLIEACADGAYGFAVCADYSNSSRHRTLFRQRAQACEEAGAQLRKKVLRLGGQPTQGGTAIGALHRGWVAVRGTLSGLRDQSILAECERGEAATRVLYQHALEQDLPVDVRTLVQQQADRVQLNLAQIRLLREVESAAA